MASYNSLSLDIPAWNWQPHSLTRKKSKTWQMNDFGAKQCRICNAMLIDDWIDKSWNISFDQHEAEVPFDLVSNQSECCIMFWRKNIFHFRIMDFTMKSLRMWAKQSECCIMLWRKSIFHFWIMDFTMKSLTVSSNGRGVSREQNKISHGCADPSPPARPENNMDVNYVDDGDVYRTQSKTWGFWGPMYRQDTLYMNSKTLGLRLVEICNLANARFLASHFSTIDVKYFGDHILFSDKLKTTD